ncbi:hypothetical protein COSO111634_05250 [Corallococcus soli]
MSDATSEPMTSHARAPTCRVRVLSTSRYTPSSPCWPASATSIPEHASGATTSTDREPGARTAAPVFASGVATHAGARKAESSGVEVVRA